MQNPKRETQKIVELVGRKWVVKKFDALTGSYIAYKLLSQLLPSGLDSLVRGQESPKLPVMSKEEFTELQLSALQVCYEKLQSGLVPVIGDNGGWGVVDIEDNASLVIGLTIHSLIFNLTGFFEGNALKDLMEGLKGLPVMSPSNVKTSTNSPSPQ